jgi:hypothetical protein
MGVPARAFTIGVVGCAALALAGCEASGTSATNSSMTGPAREPSAASLTSSMQTSVRNASGVHVAGQFSRNGVPLGIDLDVTKNGDAAGTISQRGTPLHIVATNSKIYIEVTPAFLRETSMPAVACAMACGKWAELTQGEASQLTGDLSMQKLLTALIFGEAQTSAQAPQLTKAGSTTVDGQPAWLLRADDGSTVAVSAAATHYPLAARSGRSPHQVVTFSKWDSVPAPNPPPASQLLDRSGGLPLR